MAPEGQGQIQNQQLKTHSAGAVEHLIEAPAFQIAGRNGERPKERSLNLTNTLLTVGLR